MLFPKRSTLLLILALCSGGSALFAQCKDTLSYLDTKIPTVRDERLTQLRQSILDIKIKDIVDRLRAQGTEPSKGAEAMMKQADGFDEQLNVTVDGIRKVSTNPEPILQALKARNYGNLIPAGDGILGAYITQYVASDWSQLAMRESALQVACIANRGK